jgi:hypothetical protein
MVAYQALRSTTNTIKYVCEQCNATYIYLPLQFGHELVFGHQPRRRAKR